MMLLKTITVLPQDNVIYTLVLPEFIGYTGYQG